MLRDSTVSTTSSVPINVSGPQNASKANCTTQHTVHPSRVQERNVVPVAQHEASNSTNRNVNLPQNATIAASTYLDDIRRAAGTAINETFAYVQEQLNRMHVEIDEIDNMKYDINELRSFRDYAEPQLLEFASFRRSTTRRFLSLEEDDYSVLDLRKEVEDLRRFKDWALLELAELDKFRKESGNKSSSIKTSSNNAHLHSHRSDDPSSSINKRPRSTANGTKATPPTLNGRYEVINT